MSDTPADNGWVVTALLACGGFIATLVLWVLKRNDLREDRAFAADKRVAETLAKLPAKLSALNNRVERLEKAKLVHDRELVQVQKELARLRDQVKP